MFPKSRTSTDQPAPAVIIPVRPSATASDAPAADKPDSLLRRTLGKSTYSRRTLGRGNYSRRTFGRYHPSRRTFGISHP